MKLLTLLLLLTLCNGCIVCSADRVLPKLTFRWTSEGKREIESRKSAEEFKNQRPLSQ